MEILKKAYTVWHEGMLNDNPHLGFRMDELPVTYANTPSEAKQNAQDLNDYEIDGEPHKFTDIKVRRAKMADKVMYKGREVSKWQMESQIKEEKRIQERTDKVNAFPDGTNFYVQNGYVGNSVLWWGLRSSGYTTDLSKAELYTKEEVLQRFVNGREEDRIWEAKHVLENRRQHVDGQYLNSQYQS